MCNNSSSGCLVAVGAPHPVSEHFWRWTGASAACLRRQFVDHSVSPSSSVVPSSSQPPLCFSITLINSRHCRWENENRNRIDGGDAVQGRAAWTRCSAVRHAQVPVSTRRHHAARGTVRALLTSSVFWF